MPLVSSGRRDPLPYRERVPPEPLAAGGAERDRWPRVMIGALSPRSLGVAMEVDSRLGSDYCNDSKSRTRVLLD